MQQTSAGLEMGTYRRPGLLGKIWTMQPDKGVPLLRLQPGYQPFGINHLGPCGRSSQK
ncbi:hypothetical protein J41TS12_01620 [Paenibacillus antibioticophila]|uniref:Uncharacterized protein n=1 Tax=Paenibacillus antibioticophila TaxID=1274374 RepID=A0A919XLQ0_9BACL|nr:hypothetical protein J41TS12_01620 [Paenibacillus antibioticophila]